MTKTASIIVLVALVGMAGTYQLGRADASFDIAKSCAIGNTFSEGGHVFACEDEDEDE